jgi:hypothetical protein
VIKQFNFYDIYGYLLPGTVLFALLWMPVGVLTHNWPDQDLSKALFLTALAYIAGHIIQTVATSITPSTETDAEGQARFPSEWLLDKTNGRFTPEFKAKIAGHVLTMFGLDMQVGQDGTGSNNVSSNRQTAFFQARSYLIAKKAAQYAEQFEGMYVMMRGLGCTFGAGAAYFLGWALSVRRGAGSGTATVSVLVWAAIAAALAATLVALFRVSKRSPANRLLAVFLLLGLGLCGYLAGAWRFPPVAASTPFPDYAESILWGGVLIALFVAARCFGAYRGFAMSFAETIWRDFCADLSVSAVSSKPAGGGDDEDDE